MTVVGIDVGGRRKGFRGCATRGDEIVAGSERLSDVKSAVDWVTAFGPKTVALDSPKTCAPPGESSRRARLHTEGRSTAYGEIIVPAGPP